DSAYSSTSASSGGRTACRWGVAKPDPPRAIRCSWSAKGSEAAQIAQATRASKSGRETSMHQIEAEFTFAAAHRLPRYSGKCFNLHGHNYRFQVVLRGDPDPYSGI